MDSASHRPSGCIHHRRFDHHSLGRHRPDIQVQRHVAIGHQHRYDDRHNLEGLEEADLERFRVRYEELARTAREALRRGELDTGTPEVRPD